MHTNRDNFDAMALNHDACSIVGDGWILRSRTHFSFCTLAIPYNICTPMLVSINGAHQTTDHRCDGWLGLSKGHRVRDIGTCVAQLGLHDSCKDSVPQSDSSQWVLRSCNDSISVPRNITGLRPMWGIASCWAPARRTLIPPSFALIFMPRLQGNLMVASKLNNAEPVSDRQESAGQASLMYTEASLGKMLVHARTWRSTGPVGVAARPPLPSRPRSTGSPPCNDSHTRRQCHTPSNYL